MILQHLVHAGRPHGPEDACQDVHCASCGRDGPRRWARVCGECFHAWRWGWLLSLHDLHLDYRLSRWDVWTGLPEPRAFRKLMPLHRLRLRRPSKIHVCPCCSHDM